jgi:hypothetical protein
MHESKLRSGDYRLLPWLITEFNYVLGLLHRVVTGDVADVSKMHAASIFRICPEDGCSMLSPKRRQHAKICRVQQPKNRINIKLCSGSRTSEQVLVSVYRVYSASADNISLGYVLCSVVCKGEG